MLTIISDTMEWIGKNWPAVIILIAGIGASIGAYVSTNRDSEQKDLIQNLGQENIKLSTQIKQLSDLNNDISRLNTQIGQKIEKITNDNLTLSQHNIQLSTQTQSLISQVQLLTEQSKELISKVEKSTTYSLEENLLSGGFKLDFNLITKKSTTDVLKFIYGSNIRGITESEISTYLKSAEGYIVTRAPEPLIKLQMDENKKILFSTIVYDLEGNVLVEIEKNYWRINKNLVSRFNYDENGVEIIDNKGHIVLSLNVIDNYKIYMQGIFVDLESDYFIVAGEKDMMSFNKTTKKGVGGVFRDLDYTTTKGFEAIITEVKFKRLFEYTGSDWLHKRVKYD